MRFSIQVKEQDQPDSEFYTEEYDDFSVNTQEEAEQWGRDTIAMFNATLREGERARVFLSAQILGKGKTPHDWRKASLVTERGGYDRYTCARCGATGKRHGLSSHVTPDSGFHSKWCPAEKKSTEKNPIGDLSTISAQSLVGKATPGEISCQAYGRSGQLITFPDGSVKKVRGKDVAVQVVREWLNSNPGCDKKFEGQSAPCIL